MTVLFSDLEGSTQLGDLLDPEPLRALLVEYFDSMAAVIDEWGGSVEKYIGDAIVAVFGIPIAHEDDAVRAVRAGLDMHDRLAAINPSLRDRFGVELVMRIAVNTGEVLATTDADAILAGDVFNVAARLEGLAEPGTVVVGERTHQVISGSFDFVSLGEFDVKGKTEPQAVWQVVAPHLSPQQAFETEMVGRNAELDMLDSLMQQAVAGDRPRLVLIVGEAGIGKSRLVGEFVSRTGSSVRTLLGRCLSYGDGITFWPLREVLWEAAGIALDDSSEVAATKLRSLVDALPEDSVGDPDWLAFALATTAGIALDDNPFDTLSPESAGKELQLAWPAFASALASDRPTVLAIEDIHRGEAPLLDMIEQLAVRALGPLLVVATARPEFMERRAGWGARALPSQISLGPLTAVPFERLIAQLLPGFDGERRRRILDSSGGNPFFAEEIARRARDQGMESEVAEAVPVPDTARAILAARIDQLDEIDREVLQDAAVVGEVFWPAPLERMRTDDIEGSLVTLERNGFITTRPTTSLPGQREMAFRHGLMREVAYQSIPLRRLASCHAAVGEWTEALASDRRDEFIEVIAHHYAAASQPETAGLAWRDDPERRERVRVKAVEALLEAGTAARRQFSIDQAVGYADRTLALASTDRERLSALELKAASYHSAARVDEAWPVYVESIAAARDVGDEADISRVTTEATLLWARYGGAFSGEDWKPAAAAVVQDRLAEVGENGSSLEVGALLVGRAVSGRRGLIERTSEEVRADAERAIAISEELDSPRLLSYALDAYEMALRQEGFCDLGTLADRMVGLGSDMVDRRQGHEMLVTAAIVLSEIGRYEASREVGAIALADAQEMGVHQRIHGIRALTGHMVPNGMFDALLERSEGLLELITEDGGNICDFGGGAVVGRALALFEQGRTEEGIQAVDFFERALPDVKRFPVVEFQLVERVRPFVGLDYADRLIRKIYEPSVPAHHVAAIRARLPMAVLRGDWPKVEELVAASRDLAEPCCAPQLIAFADWAEAVREGAVERARTALAILEEPYTAARLAVDFFGANPGLKGGDLRTSTEGALKSMGAWTTLAELRGS